MAPKALMTSPWTVNAPIDGPSTTNGRDTADWNPRSLTGRFKGPPVG